MAYATTAELKSYLGVLNSDTVTASAANDTLTLTDAGFFERLGTGTKVMVSTTNTLPAPLTAATIYYVIRPEGGGLAIQLATTAANADAGTEINITDAGTGTHTLARAFTDDTLLGALIDRAEAAIDSYTNRHFEAASETRYYTRDALSDEDAFLLLVDADLLEVDELTNGDSDGTVIPNTEYVLWPRNFTPKWGILLETNSAYSWQWDTDCWVSVEGSWGYSTTVPDDVKHACIRLAAYYYRQRDAGVYDVTAVPGEGVIIVPKGMPADVKLILGRYRRVVMA